MRPFPLLLVLCLVTGLTGRADATPAKDAVCAPPGQWRASDGTHPSPPSLFKSIAVKSIVLLGETHTNEDDHRWQLHTLAALHARNPNMVIGFESFPRSVQPVLDRWIRGELSEQAFLKAARWNEVWRFDPSLYTGLFHFARLNRVPMVAMNVEQALIRNVRAHGWEAVPNGAREGVGTPAAADPAYVADLRSIYEEHGSRGGPVRSGEDEFNRFVAAQLTWDRAMAEALAHASTGSPGALAVGIVGRGHLEFGYGIPHQLADLGVKNVAVLLPWPQDRDCGELTRANGTAIADYVFGIADDPADPSAQKPRLGVMVAQAPKEGASGVLVRDVATGSVADAAGIKAGDILQSAAGKPLPDTPSLIAVIQAQAPGTWLPLVVIRDGKVLDVVAKFPALAPARTSP